MKERKTSRSAMLGTVITVLALLRVSVVPSIGGDVAWVLNHIIQTAGLVCCLVWLRDWKTARGRDNREEAT